LTVQRLVTRIAFGFWAPLGILLGLLGAAASVASAAVPLIKVTVVDSSGKAAYKCTTDGKGTFATGKLQPGGYVVQFNSKSAPKGTKYVLVISAGKKKVMANAVEAEKFAAGGVAMKIDVAAGVNISGQVSAGEAQASSSVGITTIQIQQNRGQQPEGARTRSP
jgi:hypothetical protein